jgi:hypothetical protein
MKLTESTKYNVRFEGRAITQGATRKNAHNLRAKLGQGYVVWNRRTRRESLND